MRDSLLGALLDRLDKGVSPDDIFKILEETGIVLVLPLWLHHRDGLDFPLEDEESIVVQVDSVTLEELGDLLGGHLAVVDVIVRLVVAVGGACDAEGRVGDEGVIGGALMVDDGLKVDSHPGRLEVAVVGRVVDELRDLVETKLRV